MTANDAARRRIRRPGQTGNAKARPSHRRDEIEAIGLALGVLWILLVLVTTLGVSPNF